MKVSLHAVKGNLRGGSELTNGEYRMIALKYINKNAAAIAAIRDYDNMQFIIDNTPDDIVALYEKMTASRTPHLSKTPKSRNPQVGSDKLAAQIDKLDVLRERYSQAVEYMDWFEPAWSGLTVTEQRVLSEFYANGNQRSGATMRLMGELNYSGSHVERIRSTALNHLRTMLFG